ncbi:hypothetical protein G6F68_020563 [Rhizopus microsporus]|uniref:Uncharacterized protein n=1 Tax=Rhizopus delemar TaxID=936053 RepID=A0A9P7C320_9FUNG|nr:hypothetical protein G6F31_020146 [Rhizopus arrhizus]KAG1222722.1 hypothetical protein G6F68_020563 [Rhizopus microsporus]KAG1533500.1 hypothetical protein G6F50_015859 [Rhizopus delemar]
MMRNRYSGYVTPRISIVPDSHDGRPMLIGAGPQMMRVSSLKNRMKPNVASTWSRCSRGYRRASAMRSSSRPSAAMPAMTAAAASRNEPVWRNTVAAMKAPIM